MLAHVFRRLALRDFLDIGSGAQRHAISADLTAPSAALVHVHLLVVMLTAVGVMLGVTVVLNLTATATVPVMMMLSVLALTMHVFNLAAALALVGFFHNIGVAPGIGYCSTFCAGLVSCS